MLSFLKIRVIVNDKTIFPLLSTQPVVIALNDDHTVIVVTDGFHITKPLELTFREPSYYNFQVVSAINDLQLLGGFFLMAILYLVGFLTDLFVLKLISFSPVLLLLFLYYVRRKEFIRIMPA